MSRVTYKYKIYRSKKNRHLDQQTRICGNIYNHCITLKYRYYRIYGKSLNKYQLQKHLTKLKRLPKYSFWKIVGSQAIQDVTDRIERGYTTFFNNCKKKSKTRKVSPPSFKKVRSYSSFTLKQAGYKLLEGNRVKIGNKIYKYSKSREIEGDIKCVTIKKDKVGDWYILFISDVKNDSESISMTGKTAGFDFGCKTFLTSSDNESIQSPLFFYENSNKIRQANKSLSSKVKGSNNWKRARINLARIHRKTFNQRQDYHFKLALMLVREYDILFFETLNIEGMKRLWGKKISDLGFSEFDSIVTHICNKYGKEIHHIDKWYPSTKLCNVCEYKNDELELSDREWTCPDCMTHHNRDENAAVNIEKKGIEEFSVGASTDSLGNVRPEEIQAITV